MIVCTSVIVLPHRCIIETSQERQAAVHTAMPYTHSMSSSAVVQPLLAKVASSGVDEKSRSSKIEDAGVDAVAGENVADEIVEGVRASVTGLANVAGATQPSVWVAGGAGSCLSGTGTGGKGDACLTARLCCKDARRAGLWTTSAER